MGEVRTTRSVSVTILDSAAVSEAIPLQPNEKVIAVLTPSTWNAADVGIDISQDGSTNWNHVVDGTQSGALAYFRFTNIPVGTAAYNTSPADHIPYIQGASFSRIHSINVANKTDLAQTGDQVCIVFIGQEK